jgi:hypothetical protein
LICNIIYITSIITSIWAKANLRIMI